MPWFDPAGAGTKAQVLLLMESPGPQTVAVGDLGFSSLDNEDPTTQKVRRAMTLSRLDPAHCLRWNVIPWALLGPDGRRRSPRVDDLEDARPALTTLVSGLPFLKVVVTFGGAALEGWMRYLTLTDTPVLVPTLAVPHPSPANGHRRHEAFLRTTFALDRAADLCR
ncbi:uracil-DNA glycosylase [Phycicoccus sp. Root101]|uniref:uracil-DNA glycosylase n=1 Tax=Phycicoccus sp. Root101 TaxID=1736421 RepID=UPI0012FC7C8D|nr:uracil-DNA glycosylase [Phycicoccus sp. Root101]